MAKRSFKKLFEKEVDLMLESLRLVGITELLIVCGTLYVTFLLLLNVQH